MNELPSRPYRSEQTMRSLTLLLVCLGCSSAAGKSDALIERFRQTRGLYDRGEYDEAIKELTKIIRLDPTFVPAYQGRAMAWRKKGDLDRAIADYTEAIRLNPKYTLAYNNRGNVWLSKGEYDKANADFNKAIRLNPKLASAYNNRAWIMATCPSADYRNGAKAIEDATTACELGGWKTASLLATLAAAYAEAGTFDKAVEYQETAIVLETDEGMAKVFRSRLNLYESGEPYRDEATDGVPTSKVGSG